MVFVYILQSLRDGRYCVGSTINLSQRLKHHVAGLTPSTKRFGSLKLVFSQEYVSLKQARFIERKLKALKRKDYLEKIVRDKVVKMNLPE